MSAMRTRPDIYTLATTAYTRTTLQKSQCLPLPPSISCSLPITHANYGTRQLLLTSNSTRSKSRSSPHTTYSIPQQSRSDFAPGTQINMSYTTPAFVHYGDWEETTREEPSQKWFEKIAHEIFDAHKWDTPYSELYTDDMELLKPDGSTVKGGREAWAAVAQLYGPFTTQWTQPVYMVVTETDYGWEMIGQAWRLTWPASKGRREGNG